MYSSGISVIHTQYHSGSTSQSKHGLAGDGFWFRGNNNYVRGNVSSNNSSFGFTYFQQAPKGNPVTEHGVFTDTNEIRIPRFRGADTAKDDEIELINGQTQVIAQFEDNEVYAAAYGCEPLDVEHETAGFPSSGCGPE